MKTSKRPVFKLNTSELPKGYKQPLKPKKRKGRGPRRMVRSRRRNEFIPEGADWCEINGQKLRQDIFFGEKRGRKFIPDGPPNFFVPSAGASATELLEAPYGDGGDGGACGCACEGCVCGEGEGCACSGPGTGNEGGDFGQGAQDGQQGQQGQQGGQEGQQGGQEGQQGGVGYDDTGVGAPGGAPGLGLDFGEQSSSLGPTGYDDTGVGAPFGTEGLGPGYQGGYDNTGIGSPFGPEGPVSGMDLESPNMFSEINPSMFGPQTGMDMEFNPFSQAMPGLNVNPDIAERGTFDPNTNQFNSFTDNQGRSFAFDPSNPNYVTDPGMLNARDGQINSALAPGERGPSNPFAQQDLMASPLDPQSIMNIDPKGIQLDPIGPPAPTERGVLDPIDPSLYQGPFQPAEPDARGAISTQTLMEAISSAAKGLDPGLIGPAHGSQLGPTSQFGPLTSSLFSPAYNPLAENPFSNPLAGGIQSTFTTGPTVGPNPTGFSTDPGKSVGPVDVNPEAPAPANPYGPPGNINPTDVSQEARDAAIQAAVQAAPYGPPGAINPQDVTQEAREAAIQAQVNPFDLAVTAPPGITNPNIGPAMWNTPEVMNTPLDLQTSWPETPGRDPIAINPEYVPTTEQMQAARDTLTQQMQDAARGPTNQPSLDELFAAREAELIAQPNPFAPNPYADEPTTPEEIEALGNPRGLAINPQDIPTAKDRQEAIERAVALEEQERTALERAAVPLPTPNPLSLAERGAQERGSRGQEERGAQERGSRGQERGAPSRGQEFAPTSRGNPLSNLGRGQDRGVTAPNQLGLPAGLRGNPVAEALTSRGFNPDLVGVALTINDRGQMLTAMLESVGLSHAQAVATANAARGAVEAQHGLPSNRR